MRPLLAGLLVFGFAPALAQPPAKGPAEPTEKVSLALNADHSTPIQRLAFTPDGRKLVTVELNAVHLWDVSTGERERTWRLANEVARRRAARDLEELTGPRRSSR